MKAKERVLNAMQCKEVDRTPWIPFTGCHAGALIGLKADEYLKSADNIVKGISTAIERYQPDGVPVVFDLQVEAEVMGCELNWAEDNPPSVISHPLSNGTALSELSIPGPDDGRIAMCLDATRRLREQYPDIALYGLITGPFTLTLHLLGTDIFMKMFDDPEGVREVLAFSQKICEAMSTYYIEAGCDIIAVVDPMTSQIGPDQFREYVTPFIKTVFENIRQEGALGSFFVCGHAQQNIKAMCECKPDNISIDENISLEYVKDICLDAGISFGGNMQLTTVLLLGSVEDAQRNALECLEVGDGKGYLLAPGCDLPYATPPENLEGVAKLVNDPYERDVLKAKAVEAVQGNVMNMDDYGQTDKVIVDIITLDSEGCAPCQYMVEAVKRVAPEFKDIVEWREHKIKYKEALVFMTSLMVKNIPTICIDGQITFVSRIPGREELIAAIQKRIFEKLRMKIRQRRATLFVLGQDSEEREQLIKNADQAILELGADVEIETIENEDKMRSFGVMPAQTPAVVMAHYQTKSTKAVPETSIIREWIKDVR